MVHLFLPLTSLACYGPGGADSNDEEGNYEAQTQEHKLIEDCQKCVYVGSLREAQRVSDRIQALAQQKVSASVIVCLCVGERERECDSEIKMCACACACACTRTRLCVCVRENVKINVLAVSYPAHRLTRNAWHRGSICKSSWMLVPRSNASPTARHESDKRSRVGIYKMYILRLAKIFEYVYPHKHL